MGKHKSIGRSSAYSKAAKRNASLKQSRERARERTTAAADSDDFAAARSASLPDWLSSSSSAVAATSLQVAVLAAAASSSLSSGQPTYSRIAARVGAVAGSHAAPLPKATASG